MTLLLLLALSGDSLALKDIDRRLERHQTSLESTRVRLEEVRLRLSQLERTEAAGIRRLEALREQISAAQRLVDQLEQRSVASGREIAEISGRITTTESQIRSRLESLRHRLVMFYKYGRLVPIEALFSTSTIPDVARRMQYLRYFARSDRRVAGELNALRRILDNQQLQLFAAHAELERLMAEHEAERTRLESSRASEEELLHRIRTEQRIKRQLAIEMDSARGRLQDLIQTLEQQRQEVLAATDSHEFVVSRGRLPWPLRGKVISRFGAKEHPEYKTRTSNRGIDIQATARTEVLAIAGGRIAYADHFMGYGKMVIVDHGAGFYTLYSNLEEVLATVGMTIPAATPIGRTREYLHFEIRQEGRPVDPMAWLGQ